MKTAVPEALPVPPSQASGPQFIRLNLSVDVPLDAVASKDLAAPVKEFVQKITQLGGRLPTDRGGTCPVCGWIHDADFTLINLGDGEIIHLGGVLPNIVSLVHKSHANGLGGMSTKDAALLRACSSYLHPSKAFHSLKHSSDYQRLFNTRKRGFLSLGIPLGTNWKATWNDDPECPAQSKA